MKAVIKVNGEESKDSFCIVDTLSNIVTLIEINKPEIILNMDNVYVELNILGRIDSD